MTRLRPHIAARFQSIWAAILGSLLASVGAHAAAQTYPLRPVRLVAPFPAGGSNDLVSRTIAQKLGERWPHQMIVDNRPGAGGNLGAEIVAHATADGYTLLMGSSSLAVNATLYPKLSFNARTAFTAITLIGSSVHVLCVNPTVPAQTVKELIELAKAKPGQLNYASGGAGSPLHMNAELFSMPFVKNGRLRAIGVTTAKRIPALPDVPAVGETVKSYDVTNWHGLIGPKALARPLVDRLNGEVTKIIQQKDMVEKLEADGVSPAGGSPEDFAQVIAREIPQWQKVATEAKVKVE